MKKAAENADAQEMIRIRQRLDELPTYILVTRTRLERLQMNRDEAALPEVDREAKAAIIAVQKAQDKLNAARQEFEHAQFVQSHTAQSLKDLRIQIAERKRRISELAAPRPFAPVVRSAIHAQR
jgi:hypothetical protein